MTVITTQRALLRPLLNEASPAEALTAYYALHHDPRRTHILLHYNAQRQVDGFLVRAQTGLDLFRPVVVLRAGSEAVARSLFTSGLTPNRPYYLVAPLALRSVIESTLSVSDAEVLQVFQLDLSRFTPQMNVLVAANPTPDGAPRYEISRQGRVAAAAGVNWQSPHFAEVYVYTEPAVRGRGWGKAVVAALVADLLKRGLKPLYVVNEHNAPSISLASSMGFVDTGAREFAGQATLLAGPTDGKGAP